MATDESSKADEQSAAPVPVIDRGVSSVKSDTHSLQCWLCRWWFVPGFTAHHCSGLGADAYISPRGSVITPINNVKTPNNPEKGFEEYGK